MAARSTGWAMLASSSVQAAQDLAVIAHAATLGSRVPFVHFFDGFRTSHEVNVIEPVDDEVLRALMDEHLVRAHRERALSPDHPVLRGSAQNPDVFFQAREASSPFHRAVPSIVQAAMDRFVRADASRARETGGAGLGLAIAKTLMEAQGGSISIETTVGGGLTARIRLPA
jgi:pyruvate-ferredoxin/flavodoxin oxidoreductase